MFNLLKTMNIKPVLHTLIHDIKESKIYLYVGTTDT